jgi:hypothetical protein
MTAITFPNSPSSGDTHTAGNGIVYTYDGEKWTSIGTNSAGTWTRSGTEVSLTNPGDDLNVDSGTLFVDASTDRVGIGNTSPAAALSFGISADTTPTDVSKIHLYNNGSGVIYGLGVSNQQFNYRAGVSTDSHVWYAGTTERMRIDSSGNLGVGTTAPDTILHAHAGSAGSVSAISGTVITAENSGNAFVSILSPDANVGALVYGSPSNTNNASINGYYNGGSQYLNFNVAGSEAMRIDSSGRLLVGTSSARTDFFNQTWTPAYQYEGTSDQGSSLSLTCNAANTQRPVLIFAKTRGSTVGSDGLVSSSDGLGLIAFMGNDGTDNVPGAYIGADLDGTPGANDMPTRLRFSTTPDGSTVPVERIRINNLGKTEVFSSDGNVLGVGTSTGAGVTNYALYVVYGRTGVFTGGVASFGVFTNGNTVNANNSYAGISDIKLKENIVDASSQWDDIKDLRVRNYNFIEGQTHTQIGVVAQEVETVSPGLVTESPDRDEDGNDLGTTTKSVNYSVLYMKAVKALQEAMERIETLEAKVAALEAA